MGGEHVYNMGLPSFPWEGVHKYDGQGEVYKMRRSNLRVLGHFFCAVVGSLTIVALQPRFLITLVCMGLSHHNEPFMV